MCLSLQQPLRGRLVGAGWTSPRLLGMGGELTRFSVPEGTSGSLPCFERKSSGRCPRRTGRIPGRDLTQWDSSTPRCTVPPPGPRRSRGLGALVVLCVLSSRLHRRSGHGRAWRGILKMHAFFLQEEIQPENEGGETGCTFTLRVRVTGNEVCGWVGVRTGTYTGCVLKVSSVCCEKQTHWLKLQETLFVGQACFSPLQSSTLGPYTVLPFAIGCPIVFPGISLMI